MCHYDYLADTDWERDQELYDEEMIKRAERKREDG